MSGEDFPLILAPDDLQVALGRDDVRVADCSLSYEQGHIPGAAHLDYGRIVCPRPPATGLLPEEDQLAELCASLGLGPDTRVVTCDDEGGGKAARLLWTLQVAGHTRCSLLDGGLTAWRAEQRPLATYAAPPPARPYSLHINDALMADKDHLLACLDDPGTVIVDCRSPAEYRGEKAVAHRGGHIPGAVNVEWSRALDPQRHTRLRATAELRALYKEAGVTPDKEIITYCHSHRRSAHSYVVLKSLGYPRVRGYPGSWSEWGNDDSLPVET